MAYKGKFLPRNPQKYKGDPTNIVYRSRWELMCMQKFDSHPSIVLWNSEEIVIPYRSPIDGKIHRYFPDFWIKKKDPNNNFSEVLIEVKPFYQTKAPPLNSGKPNKRYLNEVANWGINSSKWEQAMKYCQDRNWQFQIITEKELGLKF